MILINVVYNFTEASFDKTSPLWFAFLLVMTQYRPHSAPARSDRAAGEDTDQPVPTPRRFPVEARW
jgi:hypothetical protein